MGLDTGHRASMLETSAATEVSKVELHCHWDAVLDAGLLRRLAKQGGDFPVTVEQLDRVVPVTSFEEWSHHYAHLFAACTPSREGMMKVMAAHVASLAEQRVQYAEIMVSGQHPRPRRTPGVLSEQQPLPGSGPGHPFPPHRPCS
jgi:hypothetical protein